MGAAFMILESEIKGEVLAGNIRELYEGASLRADMQKASRGLGRSDACSRIVDIAMSLVRGNNAPLVRNEKMKTGKSCV
jgi:hypothetical protein